MMPDRPLQSTHEQDYHNRPPHMDYAIPAFDVGMNIAFCDDTAKDSGSGTIARIVKPGEKGKRKHGGRP